MSSFRGSIVLTQDDYADAYGVVCDVLCRTLWADKYGIPENAEDDYRLSNGQSISHTSSEARRVATAVFEALHIEFED